MLRIWMGRANTGKSGRVLEAIRGGGGGALLLVPEHASHAAELDLCRAFASIRSWCLQAWKARWKKL